MTVKRFFFAAWMPVAALSCPVLGGTSFTITPLVLEGDSVSGVGLVTRIDNIAVNDNGGWIVEADTDNADTEADGVLLENGSLLLREGDALRLPTGASIGSFDSININDAGDSAWNFFLDGTKDIFDDSGIYQNTTLVLQEGSTAPTRGLSPGTSYIGFFDVKNSNNNHFMSVLSIDDPAIPTSVDRAIIVFQDPGMGFTRHLIAKEGDVLPDQTEGIADFGTGPHQSAFNDTNDILVFVDLEGDTTTDGVIYKIEVDDFFPDFIEAFVNVAQEGSPSPVAGRDWLSLSSPELDLNNEGEHVYSGRITGDTASDTLIVRDGAKFRQEGDSIFDFALTSFGTGPVEISDGGLVLWYGDWSDPDTDIDTGLFLDDVLLVREGVTEIDGVIVDTLAGVEDGYHMSNSGLFVIFEAVLTDGREGAFLIELDIPCPGDCGDKDDFTVSTEDLLALLAQWGGPGSCDIDGGGVGTSDLLALLANWGPCP